MKEIILVFFILLHAKSLAQEKDSIAAALRAQFSNMKGQVEGLDEAMAEVKSTVDMLRRIKLSGYIQSQFQAAEGDGIGTFAGGNFPSGVHSRFQVRRGRLKMTYDNNLTTFVLQLDVTQNGVGIKDAYASVKEPWLRMVNLTAGVFDRPFGFEVSYSSSTRETPERTRLFQTLFPGERELGAKIEIAPPESSPLSIFNLKIGLFNGVLSTANENDNQKDLIGRVGAQIPFPEEGLALDGGLSLYAGKVRSNSRHVYEVQEGEQHFLVDSTSGNVGSYFSRTYLGGDIQIYYDAPAIGGLSIRGEYIVGEQPGSASSSGFYNPGSITTPLYRRNFAGWYLSLVQNLGERNQLLVKYDEYDPNIDVKGERIGELGRNLTIADIKYATLGIGWVYHWDSNVKLTLYYDVVRNESVSASATAAALIPYKQDIKDNVTTIRLQYKF
ncbi:MAG TPA: hypothetical protein DCP63_06805 [Bacteroidetes bacterium]|nr:hypothetical protein [Bacteroidota bacterium]